jgi:hypothetical protein
MMFFVMIIPRKFAADACLFAGSELQHDRTRAAAGSA